MRNVENESDRTLCLRASTGDQRAFRVLVGRYENSLRSFLSRLADAQVADDLSQEAFVKAWLGLKRFRGESQFSTWIHAIGWRCFLDHARKNRVRRPLPDESPTVSHTTDAALDVERLLNGLTAAERAALVLCEGHGWSHTEAAVILAIPLGTLKSVIKRAKEKCRARLGKIP